MGTLKSTATLFPVLLFSVISMVTGCRICADCEDLAYPAYGGVWQRTIRDSGRVGSLFDPAGAKSFDLASREQPEAADQLERKRNKAKGGGVNDPEEAGEGDKDLQQDQEQDQSKGSLKDLENEFRDKDLDDIENPKEKEQQERELDEIDVRILKGDSAPPVL